MKFLISLAVVLVALGSVLVEVDWLTKPKLELKIAAQKAKIQTTTVAAPVPPKIDGPNVELSPVYPTGPAQQSEQSAAAPPAQPGPAAEARAPSNATVSTTTTNNSSQPVPAADAATTSSVTVETTGSGSPTAANSFSFTATNPLQSFARFQPAVTPQPAATQSSAREAATPTTTAPQPKSAASQSANRCDMAACAGMYQSFRAADCTYQPLEGPRRVCAKPPAAGQQATRERNAEPREQQRAAEAAAHKRSKDAELREVSRVVKRLTESEASAARAEDDEPERIIVIRRSPRW